VTYQKHPADNMIHTLTIQGYRGFSHLEVGGLGRVNLLVGRNNSGKSSVLEALYLLATNGDPSAVWRVLTRRGEQAEHSEPGRAPRETQELDVSHLFHGHELRPGALIEFSTKNSTPDRRLAFSIREFTTEDENPSVLPLMNDGDLWSPHFRVSL
jgi:predicted ATPase